MENPSPDKYRVYAGEDFSIGGLRDSDVGVMRGLQIRESCFEDYFYYKVKMKGE